MTPGLPFGPHPCNPFALVASPKLGLRHKGLPPHKVQVTRHGKIDGACEGKDAWDGAIRSLAPQILNMAAVRVTEQDPVDMARLRL